MVLHVHFEVSILQNIRIARDGIVDLIKM